MGKWWVHDLFLGFGSLLWVIGGIKGLVNNIYL